MASAFQSNAFQNNAFQTTGAGGPAFQSNAFQSNAFQLTPPTTAKAVVGWFEQWNKKRYIPVERLREILEEQGSPWAKELAEACEETELQEPKSKKHANALREIREEVSERISYPINWELVITSLRASLAAGRATLAIKHAEAALRALRHNEAIEAARKEFERRQEEEDEEAAIMLLLH